MRHPSRPVTRIGVTCHACPWDRSSMSRADIPAPPAAARVRRARDRRAARDPAASVSSRRSASSRFGPRTRRRPGIRGCRRQCRRSTSRSTRPRMRRGIHAWWWPDDDADAPVVLYLHGARWNLTGNLNRIAQLHDFGFSVFAIDYRGFGKSDGDLPSEATVYEDARVGWALGRRARARSRAPLHLRPLARRRGRRRPRRESRRRSRDGARGLIIESSFTNFAEMTSEITRGSLPVGDAVAEIRLRSARSRTCGCRCSSCTAKATATCRSASARRCTRRRRMPKRLLLVPNGSHNNSSRRSADPNTAAGARRILPAGRRPRRGRRAMPAVEAAMDARGQRTGVYRRYGRIGARARSLRASAPRPKRQRQ